jgi:hypothetical protein
MSGAHPDNDVALQILNLPGPNANVELLDRTVDMFYGAVTNEQVRVVPLVTSKLASNFEKNREFVGVPYRAGTARAMASRIVYEIRVPWSGRRGFRFVSLSRRAPGLGI